MEKLLRKAKDILNKGIELQHIKDLGTSDASALQNYMTDREVFMEDVTKFLVELPSAMETEFSGINEMMKTLRKEISEYKEPTKELTRSDVAMAITKAMLFARKGSAAFGTEQSRKALSRIVFPGEFVSPEVIRQKFMGKDAVDTNLDPGGTYAGLTINPIYERELLKYMPETSDMYNFSRRLPMVAPQHSWPYLSSRTFVATRTGGGSSGISWDKASKIADKTDGPAFGSRVTLTATTWAAYIPWIDEFNDDLQISESLAALMMECYLEAAGEDYDENLLTNDSGDSGVEYNGLLNTSGTQNYVVASSDLYGVMPDELDTALLEISRKERDGGVWILHESVLARLKNVRDANGQYLYWTPPSGGKPALLAGAPYVEAHVMPTAQDINAGDTFMAYANPNNLWVGERQGLEVKTFDMTTYQLEYGENFTRWRLRNGFVIPKPAATLLVKLAN